MRIVFEAWPLMAPYARRTDSTQRDIVAALRAGGRLVIETFRSPGFVDLVVATRDGRWVLGDCKSSGGKLTPAQAGLMFALGSQARICIWETPDEALRDTE